MSKTQSQSRRQRRSYELLIKKSSPSLYKQIKPNVKERGEKLHYEHIDEVRKSESQVLESIQTAKMIDMKNKGFSDSEIDKHIAIWTKTIKMWGSDGRKMKWKDAEKEYNLEISNKVNNDNYKSE